MKVLDARGLSASFADIIEIGEDIEEAQKRIETLDKLFKAAVADEVKKRLGSNTPKEAQRTEPLTVDDFHKMNLTQRSNLYNTNPELYFKLSG
jgi:hypothetical protein